jgi:Concanavalin A-like lectin/glucanases superfamily
MQYRATVTVLAISLAGCSIYSPPSEIDGGAAGGTVSSSDSSGANTTQGGASGGPSGGAGGEAGAAGSGGEVDGATDVGLPGMSPVDGGTDKDVLGTSMPDVATDRRASPDASTCAGFALQFGGFQGYVRVNRPVEDDFTLEAWIKASAPGIAAGTQFWHGSGLLYADAATTANDFGTSILGTKFAFGVGNPDTTITSTSDVTGGAWVHLAATRRKTTGEIQVFVNGTMETSKTVTGQINSLTAQPNMTIGGNALDNRYFAGLIDEVRAWNVVRTAAEIASTMHQRLTGKEPGLVGYWRFDEGSGITAADASQNAPDGASSNNGDLFGPINWLPSDAPICQ